MRKFKFISPYIYAAGLLLAGGCAADLPDEPVNTPDSEESFWVSFRLASGMTSDATNSEPYITRADEKTRATSTDKSTEEQRIHKIVGILFETDDDGNPTVRVGKSEIQTSTAAPKDGVSKRVLNFGLPVQYELHKKYRLYLYANFDMRLFNSVNDAEDRTFNGIAKKTATVPSIAAANLTKSGLAMSTPQAEGLGAMVYFPGEEIRYPENAPYPVQPDVANPTPSLVLSESPSTMTMTPLHARIDFVVNGDNNTFTYPIGFTETENNANIAKTEVNVQFLKASIVHCGAKVYLEQHFNDAKTAVISPNLAKADFDTLQNLTIAAGTAAYIPEYVPKVGTSKSLTFGETTYMEFTGILQPGDFIDQEVKNALDAGPAEEHPALYYYDDGTIQSALTVKAPASGATNWITLTYDESLGGYPVTYRHAIRHKAGENDGVCEEMEYGVVRNYIYEVGIESVSALPHPWTTDTPVEQHQGDINIRIIPPKKWVYHRQGVTLTF